MTKTENAPRNKGVRRDRDLKTILREALDWPGIATIADEYSLPERTVRSMVASGHVEAVRSDIIRINPESFAEYMATRYYGG